MHGIKDFVAHNIIYAAWIQACVATFGSLYFSEVMKLPPCTLCWYQRILMYPLVLVIAVGLLRRDRGVSLYVIPISLLGFIVGVYHNLLYYRIIPEEIQPCTVGIPCTTVQIEWLGFITIPIMSLTAFSIINICMLTHRRLTGRSSSHEPI